jgi:predicted Fe-S protein YdhL (DUF1289 family)
MNRDLGDERVASPCVSVCAIDAVSGLCVGCYRTLEEIAVWIDLSNAARRAIVGELANRRALHGPDIESRLAAVEANHGQR